MFLFNSSEPSQAKFTIEFKLRYLVNDDTSSARIFAMFDCCRVPLQGIPALCGRGDENEKDFNEEHEDTVCKYFHIQACGPGGIADADGGFAKRLYDHAAKMSKDTKFASVD